MGNKDKIKRVLKFVLVSGTGFIFDLIVYNLLTLVFRMDVDISNMISSLFGATYIFFTSTKKVFQNNTKRIPLKYKYLIYIVYQLLFIWLTSKALIYLKDVILLSNIKLFIKYVTVIVKIMVTPITLTINYFVMRYLTKL